MKKFNWKLLLVVAMVLVLVVCVVACNNDKNNNKKPPRPNNPSIPSDNQYVEQKAFMDELYNVTMGIGNEGSIGTGKDVYLDIDLGIALGTRSAATADDGKKVNLGIALKGIIDRSTTTGANTALEVKLSRTDGTILDLFYVAADNAMYVEFGGQKTTVNIDLIGLDDILFNGKTGLLNKDITLYVKGAKGDTKKGDTVDEAGYKIVDGKRVDGKDPKILLDEEGYQLKNGERVVKSGSPFTVTGLINDIAATAGDDFTVEKLVAVIVEKLGGLGDIGSMLGTLGFTDKKGNLDIYAALHNNLVLSLVSVPAAENTGNNHKAIISLGTNSTGTLGSMLGGALGSLGLGDKDGLDVGIGFQSQNGKLTNGLTISADFTIDKSSPAHEFVEQSGNKDLFPFVELSFNSLKFAPAAGKSVAPANKADYANDLQLTIDENIHIEGLYIGGALASAWPSDIRVYATANLDLKDATAANKTEIYAYLQVRHLNAERSTSPLYKTEYLYGAAMPIELQYKNGKLTFRVDDVATVLDASGAVSINYSMLLASTIGNMIDGLLSGDGLEEAKATFDERYWAVQPDEKGENGTFKTGFQGLVVNGLTVKNIIDMIKAPKEEEPVTPPTSGEEPPAEEEPEEDPNPAPVLDAKAGKGNILTTIMYAIQLIDSEPGKLNLTSKDGLLGTVIKFGTLAMGMSGDGWKVDGLRDYIADLLDSLIRGFTHGQIGAEKLIMIENGIEYGADLKGTFANVFEELGNAVDIKFDFTKGFDWDINIKLHDEPEVGLTWTSRIGLGTFESQKDIRTRLQEEYNTLKTALEEGGEYIKANEDAQKAKTEKQAEYDNSALKKDYDEKNAAATEAETNFVANENSERLAGLKALLKSPTISAYTFTTYLKKPLMNYLSAKYVDTTDHTDETATALETAKEALRKNFEGRYPNLPLAADRTSDDAISAIDALYNDYATEVGAKRAIATEAQAKNEASAEYLAKLAADKQAAYTVEFISYAQKRLDIYSHYLTNNFDELKAAIAPAKEADDAYNTARETFDNAIADILADAAAYEQAVNDATAKCEATDYGFNVYSYLPMEEYCKYYAANKIDSNTISEEVVQQKLSAITSMASNYNGVTLSEADIKAVAEAYCKAFSVTIEDGVPKAVKKSDAITNAVTDYIQFYAANKKDAENFTTEMVTEKQNALQAVITENNLQTQLTDEVITALAEKYAAAYDVTISGTSVSGETNKLAAAQAAFDASYVWCEITL